MQPHTSRFTLTGCGLPAFAFASFAWPRFVATLPIGPKAHRLAQYRNPVTGPYYHAPHPDHAGKGRGFYLDDTAAGLRWQWADEVAGSRVDNTGWFCDDYQLQKIRGLVARLPRGRGFLAGWSMGENMASVLDCEIYDDETDAARAADSMAESAAEIEREYQEEQLYEYDDA